MNIVFILCDQLRYDALSCNGATVCKTPNIDSIAAEGANMSSFYSANALCSPARATILTGLYPHMHGQLANMGNFNNVFDSQVLSRKGYAEYLKEKDFNTGYAGKWHLPEEGNKDKWKFDQWYTSKDYHQFLLNQGIDYEMGRDEVAPIEFGENAPFFGPCTLNADQHEDAWTTEKTCEMMDEFHKTGKDFFVCAAYHGPHFPYAVPEPYNKMYNPKDVPRYENFSEMFTNKPIVQQMELMRWNTAQLTWPDWQKVIAAYWGYVSYIDMLVGKILNKIKTLKIEENTAIIFTADHGDMLGSHRLFNKGFNMYEEDYHIPLLIKWPGISQPGFVSDLYCGLTDLFPTFLQMAGVEIPEGIHGKSLEEVVNGSEQGNWRDCIMCEFNGYESTLLSIRMIRTKKWKYIYNPFDRDELYDMESDPGELYNLAPLPAFTHVLRRMRAKLLFILQNVDDGIVEVTSWQSNYYRLMISEREK